VQLRTNDAQLSASQSIFRRVRGSENILVADVHGFRCQVSQRRDGQRGRWVASGTVMEPTPLGWRVVAERQFADRAEAEKFAIDVATKLPKPEKIPANPFQARVALGLGAGARVQEDRTATQMLDAALPQPDRTTEDTRVELSDSELHRAARAAIGEADRIVFDDLASLLAEIIRRRLWERYGFFSFASFSLASRNGLGITTNGRLWLLRCALDVHGKHMREWSDVLAQVEAMVRLEAKKAGRKLGSNGPYGANTLSRLGRDPALATAPISYLPSQSRGPGALDGLLVRLRKKEPAMHERVIARELSLHDAVRKTGMVGEVAPVEQLRRLIRKLLKKLSDADRRELRELLA
jgi:hypothetical protein